jgi:protein O-mannosyl-transferase
LRTDKGEGVLVKTRSNLPPALALFVITALLYARAAFFPFSIVDDNDYVAKNIHVLSGLSLDALKWAATAFYAGNWHPLTWMSLMLDGQFFGDHPAGYHLVNVVLHALNASLLFLLFRSMTGAVRRSAFVAACFALHPLHVESVAWIAERKDVLSSLFLILTLLFYSNYAKRSKIGFYLLSLGAFALGLTAKAMLVTVPAILIVLDLWPLGRLKVPFLRSEAGSGESGEVAASVGIKRLILEKIPFGMLSIASSVVTLFAQKSNLSNLTGLPLYDRVTNALWSTVMYIEKMLLPVNLAIFYPFFRQPLWKAGLAVVLLGAISFLAIKFRQSRPYLLSGWLWYLITLLPVIGILQVGRQSMADRYTYIPLIGLFTVISWGGADLGRHFPKGEKTIRLAAVGTLLLLALGTWVQLGYWRDNISLLSHTLDVTENNSFAHDCLGLVYEEQGKPELAEIEFRRSLAIEPADASVHYSLAYLLDSQNRVEEAISHYQEAIALNPGFAEAHFSLGIMKGRLGDQEGAAAEFVEAIRIKPDNPKYRNNLGTLYARNGMLDAAVEEFSQALRLDPNDPKANDNLQTALREKAQTSREK